MPDGFDDPCFLSLGEQDHLRFFDIAMLESSLASEKGKCCGGFQACKRTPDIFYELESGRWVICPFNRVPKYRVLKSQGFTASQSIAFLKKC